MPAPRSARPRWLLLLAPLLAPPAATLRSVGCDGCGHGGAAQTLLAKSEASASTTERPCTDTDNGAVDKAGESCDWWSTHSHYCHYVSYYDDKDFTGGDMCCACYGGEWEAVGGAEASTNASTTDVETTTAEASTSASTTDVEITTPTTTGREHDAEGPSHDFDLDATTAVPAPSTSTSASPAQVTGDPHVVNVRGDRFDILHPGRHILVVLPRGAPRDQAQLYVEAKVENLASCGAAFISAVNVAGRWLEAPGFPGTLGFHTDLRGLGPSRGGFSDLTSLRVGNTTAGSLAEFERLVPSSLVQVSAEKHTPHREAARRVKALAVTLRFRAGTELVVSFMLTRSRAEGGRRISHLDFAAHGLGAPGLGVGGLLGEDAHQSVSAVPRECRGLHTAAPARQPATRLHAPGAVVLAGRLDAGASAEVRWG